MKIREKMKARQERKQKRRNVAITQQNIEEKREEILAKGKKFKQPFQYAKHRLVINAIAIGVVALVSFIVVGWVQLYRAQNTGEVMYRFTRVLGLPVAEIDGVVVRYSDYLMLYRSSVAAVERQQGEFDDSEDSMRQKNYYKRQALSDAEADSYALAQLARRGLAVTNEEIDELVNEHKMIDGEMRSDSAFEGIISDNFGLSLAEYRRLLELSLAKKKLSVEIDAEAKATAEGVKKVLAENGNDFAKTMEMYAENSSVSYEETAEVVSSSNLDGGRAAMATGLPEVGAVSELFVSKNGDGYYIVKVTEKSEGKVRYQSIFVRFMEFDRRIQELKNNNKIKEYIELSEG